MKKLMNILMLSCQKATELIEKKMYFRLSKVENIQLHMHKSMCEACTNYENQSKILDKALSENDNSPELAKNIISNQALQDIHPSTDFKKNLIKILKNKK
jgi:hypothetical protein